MPHIGSGHLLQNDKGRRSLPSLRVQSADVLKRVIKQRVIYVERKPIFMAQGGNCPLLVNAMSKFRMPRSPYLNSNFAAAMKQFGLELIRTSSIQHSGNKGKKREESLRKFFSERLPSRYSVSEGEVVDLRGNTGPQLDLMFFDSSENFPLTGGEIAVLPAESLLASVDVKSKLDANEIKLSVEAAKRLRALQPYGKPLSGKNMKHENAPNARYFHCLFAYDTDLSERAWIAKEFNRFDRISDSKYLFDVVYILGRGYFNIPNRIAMQEDEIGQAITGFYFSILNFIQREAGRRKPTPYQRYAQGTSGALLRLG